MSTRARKDRKRAGAKIAAKPVKIPTPLEQRSDLNGVVPGVVGTRYTGKLVARSTRRLVAELRARGIESDQ